MASNNQANFSGTWHLVKSHNLESFLKECGVGFMRRNLAKAVSPVVYITQDGDNFVIKTDTVHRSVTLDFSVDVKFKSFLPWEAEEVLMVATWEGDKLVIKTVERENGPVFSRYIEEDHLVLEQEMNSVTCKRYFKRKEAAN